MPTNSSILAWEVTEEPAGPQSPWGGKERDSAAQLNNSKCVNTLWQMLINLKYILIDLENDY